MIFIIGGRGQGQNEYARKCLSKMCGMYDKVHDREKAQLERAEQKTSEQELLEKRMPTDKMSTDTDPGRKEMRIADGQTDTPECALDAELVLNLHLFVKKVMEREENPRDFIAELLRTEPEIITMDEIGCGIVPMDAFDRKYRDEAGIAGQMTASQAECMIRMICGIPQKIR